MGGGSGGGRLVPYHYRHISAPLAVTKLIGGHLPAPDGGPLAWKAGLGRIKRREGRVAAGPGDFAILRSAGHVFWDSVRRTVTGRRRGRIVIARRADILMLIRMIECWRCQERRPASLNAQSRSRRAQSDFPIGFPH